MNPNTTESIQAELAQQEKKFWLITTAILSVLITFILITDSATPSVTVDDCYDIYETTAGIKQCIADVEVIEDMLDDEADWKNSLGRTGY